MRRRIDFLNEVAQKTDQTLSQNLKNGETVKQYLSRIFNFYHQDFNSRYNWPWRQKEISIQTIANYITGTVTVTNGSRIVTGVGTVFIAAMRGRFLKLDRDTEIYEILSIDSNTQLTLVQPYIGNTGSELGYRVWARYLNLPPDVSHIGDVNISRWPHSAKHIPFRQFNNEFIDSYLTGFPSAWTWGPINRRVSVYNTGNVSTIVNSLTLTGTLTTFLDNMFEGSEIRIGSNRYNTEFVDSDTSVTLVQNGVVTVSNITDYEVITKNRETIMLSSVPDPIINLYVSYPKKTYDFVNDEDRVEIWEGFHHILVDAMHGSFLEKLTSDKAFNWLTIYNQEIEKAWQVVNNNSPIEQVPIVSSRTMSGYRKGLYA